MIHGVALHPGTSRNGNKYTRDNIARAVQRGQARIADPTALPITVRTHHPDAGQDSVLGVIGRITHLEQDGDGAMHYRAELADTSAGQDAARLMRGPDPFLSGVSIRGAWVGPVSKERHPDPTEAGRAVSTAPDLEVHGIDLTDSPSVHRARVNNLEESERMAGMFRESAPSPNLDPSSVEPATPELPPLHSLDEESWRALSRAHLAGVWQGMTDRKAAGGGSPFLRDLNRSTGQTTAGDHPLGDQQ